MPLVRIDAYEGRSQEAIKDLLDGVHREIRSAFHIPLRDRYQIYQEHAEPRLIVEDTGLAIERIRNAVVVTITSRQRTLAPTCRSTTGLQQHALDTLDPGPAIS
jgi:hypothetical protein